MNQAKSTKMDGRPGLLNEGEVGWGFLFFQLIGDICYYLAERIIEKNS